jgi:CRISPR-associated endonuclease Cas1
MSQNSSTVPRSGVITLYGYNIRVFVERGHLILDDGIGADRRHFRLARVGHGLRRLVIVGADGFVSFPALRWLESQGASLSFLERDGRVLVTTGPVRSSDVRLRRCQALARSSGAAVRIARELVRQKITGQANVARYKLLDTATADAVDQFATELPNAKTIPAIRLIEAQAASKYWSAWRTLPIGFPKKELPRIPEHWRTFGRRISPLTGSPRLAVTPGGAMMNYLLALLEAEASLAARALGLDAAMGVFHVDQPNRDSLACDLMEPVRPLVDSYLLDWITTQPLRREWFFEQRNGNARLMASLTEKLSETAPIWARAVAPVAEWVAQTLWRGRKCPNSERLLPTRLTQRRKSEGRGNDFVVRATRVTRQLKICQVCGAEGVNNRYCKSCAVEVSRETMAQVALIGHAKRTTQARVRVSRVLSDHAVANSWWSASSLPDWLNEECYLQEVLPKLRTIKVREIAQALNVSKPYAAQIRGPTPGASETLAGAGANGGRWRRRDGQPMSTIAWNRKQTRHMKAFISA